jgi:hypothetical protein
MKKDIEKKRMLELAKSLESSNEIYKKNNREVNEEKILKENSRLKELVMPDRNMDFKNENYYIAGKFGTGGRGKTVNTILDDYQDSTNSSVTTPKVSSSNLKHDEALEVAIKRVLKSGVPVNNISFYDEVNWNLMNLGFPAVNSIEIKNSILAMIGD